MHESGCTATFSRDQRTRFLDTKTIEKLERLQQQDEIRKAELPNLSTCPFCDFAAICPPVEEDREFRCYNPECAEVSCRLCKLKSHIPLTCAESKKENGVSERRVIEEARTEALIRTCGKCKIRILKEDGCNKVICTSCYAVLCDYCGKDITKVMYNHFDGQGRAPPGLITDQGGKCPLYDESSKRKDQQVDQAEKDAMSKVRAEHPELSEEDLKIKFAKSVQSPTNPDSRLHHRYHRMMRDIHGGPPRDLDFHGFNGVPPHVLPPYGVARARNQAAQHGQQPDVGVIGGPVERLQNELREQQAAVRLAHQNLERQQQQRQQALGGHQAQIVMQYRRQAEQAQRLQEMQHVQRHEQRRAQVAQNRVQRRRDLAQTAAPLPVQPPLNPPLPVKPPLNPNGNDPWAAVPVNNDNNNPFGPPRPLFDADDNDIIRRNRTFGGYESPFDADWEIPANPVAFNPANFQPIQYGNRDQNVATKPQTLNPRQQRPAQARVGYHTLQEHQAAQQRQQPRYEPWLGDFLRDVPELEGWNNGSKPNDQPPAPAVYDWQ